MRPAWLILSATVAACSFTPRGDGDTIDAPDPIDATDGGSSDPDAPDGSPACTPACNGNIATTCNGSTPVVETCALGCNPSPAPHCRAFSPSNGATAADLAGVTAGLLIDPDRIFLFHTETGLIEKLDANNLGAPPTIVRSAGLGVIDGLSFRRAAQAGSPIGLGVWGATGLTIQPGGTAIDPGLARFLGPRAGVVVTLDAITIHGAVDAGSGRSDSNAGCRECGGAGGGNGGSRTAPATGCAPGGNGLYAGNLLETGGAGGGMSTPGSDGGDADQSGGAAASIAACADATLIPLAGGSGGGRGGYNPPNGGGLVGGGGGGAVQLTSLTSLTVTAGADLYAGGQGGAGSDADYGGGGGGSGGALLLEAPTVSIIGARVTANGGGGGSGRTASNGEAGNRSASRASGGTGDPRGSGGRGGVSTDPTASNGLSEPGDGAIDGTGGGGASAGRIRINTAAATPPTVTGGAIISPAAAIGTRPID